MAKRRATKPARQEKKEPRLMTAAAAAKTLALRFLATGGYDDAPHARTEVQPSVSSVRTGDGRTAWDDSESFAGLKVHAVLYEPGVTDGDVIIYATKGSAKSFRALPKTLGGVPIRVRKITPVLIDPEASEDAGNGIYVHERDGRVTCGSSCAPGGVNYAGTLGCLVRRKGSELCALSANHVFGDCNHTAVHMPILAPANSDSSPNWRAVGAIARHLNISVLRSGHPDLVDPCTEDVAIATVTDPSLVSSWQGDDNDGYDTPSTVIAPAARMRVKKFGRTTGLTTGFIEGIADEAVPVPYDGPWFKGTVWFRPVWYARADSGPFALPGDSGSLIVTEDGSKAVGMVFAAERGGASALFTPISDILKLFGGLKLVSGHGVA